MPRKPVPVPKVNRVHEYVEQIEDYWFHGIQTKLARDAGVTQVTLSRILRGATNPRYVDICKIVDHLERKLDIKIDPRDVYRP